MKGGTIKETKNFNDDQAEVEAQRLRKSMKGLGTDERVIIKILTEYNAMERQRIAELYKNQYGRNLKEDLKSELSGHFEAAVLALLEYENYYLAQWCHRAIQGAGTDEKVLIEILCGCKQDMVDLIDAAYKKLFGCRLEDDMEKELSGHLKHLIIALLQASRDDDGAGASTEEAKKIAEDLYDAGEGKNSATDEEEFIRILVRTSYPLLKQVIEEYKDFAGNTLENAIEKEFSGDIKKALQTVVLSVKDQVAFFAKALYESMDGPGTDDDTLIRILVTRSEIDLQDIKDAYYKMYKKSLADAVKDDTSSGEYRKLLLAIIK